MTCLQTREKMSNTLPSWPQTFLEFWPDKFSSMRTWIPSGRKHFQMNDALFTFFFVSKKYTGGWGGWVCEFNSTEEALQNSYI